MNELETVVVSRKTPRDGKLEISSSTAAAIGGEGAEVAIRMDSQRARASVVTMPCGCKGETKHLVHTFLASELFRNLTPDSSVVLSLDAAANPPEVLVSMV